MIKKFFQTSALIALCFLSFQQLAFGQFPLFAGPSNESFCLTSGATVNFDVFYINDSGSPVTPTSFTFASTDITIMLAAPGLGTNFTFSVPGTGVSGASYTLYVTNDGNDYEIRLEIDSGIIASMNGMLFSCEADDGGPTVSGSAVLTVLTPITVSIDSPAGLMSTSCEGEDVTIDASTSAVPDSYRWRKDGATTVATTEDLTLSAASITESGVYTLEISDAGCPDVSSSPVTVLVAPDVVITDTDMTAKELAPGDTKTFAATATNVDGTSVYTWIVDGNSFTAGMLPATITVGGNMVQVNSISNSGIDPITMTSTVSLTNLSGSGVPSFTAALSLSVTNNAACIATTATLMSSSTTIFPVEWTYFNAKRVENENVVMLEWETASENNNEKFIIERSVVGRNFNKIGEVLGAGTDSSANRYQWQDKNLPNASSVVYRLRQIDFDGEESFSEIETIQLKNSAGLFVNGVSVQDGFSKVILDSTMDGLGELKIFDARGIAIVNKGVYISKGIQEVSLDFQAPKGMYFLHLQLGTQAVTTSFVN